MFRKGQLVRDVLNNQPAIVLFLLPKRSSVSILYLHTLRVCKKDIRELEPYDPDDPGGGASGIPVIVFTSEEVNELSKLIEVNGGTLGSGEILYRRKEQLAVINKLLHLRRRLTQNEIYAFG